MTPEEAGDLERARSIAVSLEQELAQAIAERDRAITALETIAAELLAWSGDPGDVVGQESLPCGDPWAELDDGPWDGD